MALVATTGRRSSANAGRVGLVVGVDGRDDSRQAAHRSFAFPAVRLLTPAGKLGVYWQPPRSRSSWVLYEDGSNTVLLR
jgi:hypothetical protein